MSEAKRVILTIKVDGENLAEYFKHLGDIVAAIEDIGGVVEAVDEHKDKKPPLCGHYGNCRCATPKTLHNEKRIRGQESTSSLAYETSANARTDDDSRRPDFT